MTLPTYSQRHLDPAQAEAYRKKFKRSLVRRLSGRRETKLVEEAFLAGLAWLQAQDGQAANTRTLLDSPCGAGRFAVLGAKRVAHYIASDHSPAMLELTRQALAKAKLEGRLQQTVEGDARTLALPDQSVDIAFCLRLTHHFPERNDRIQILSELRRVSRGPLITTYLDKASSKQRRHVAKLQKQGKQTRRVLLNLNQWQSETIETGWKIQTSKPLSGFFSGLRIVLCTPTDLPVNEPRKRGR